jgi:hypothetical protein
MSLSNWGIKELRDLAPHCSSQSDAASQSALTRRPHKESGANPKHEPCFHCVQREPEAQ